MQVDLKFKIKAGDGQITFPIYRVPVSGGSEPVDAGDIQSLQVDLDRQVLQSSQKEVMVTAAYSNVAEGAHQIVITGALNNVAFALVYAVRAEELGVPAEVVAPNAYVSLAPTGEGTIEQQIKDLQDRMGTAEGEIVAITAALSDMATKEEVQETLDKILEAIQALPDGQAVSAQVALNTAAIEGLQGDVSQLGQSLVVLNSGIEKNIENIINFAAITPTEVAGLIPIKSTRKFSASPATTYGTAYIPVEKGKVYKITTIRREYYAAYICIGFCKSEPANNVNIDAPIQTFESNTTTSLYSLFMPMEDGYMFLFYYTDTPNSFSAQSNLKEFYTKEEINSQNSDYIGQRFSLNIGTSDAKRIYDKTNSLELSTITGAIVRNNGNVEINSSATAYGVKYIAVEKGKTYALFAQDKTCMSAYADVAFSKAIPTNNSHVDEVLCEYTETPKSFDIFYTATENGYIVLSFFNSENSKWSVKKCLNTCSAITSLREDVNKINSTILTKDVLLELSGYARTSSSYYEGNLGTKYIMSNIIPIDKYKTIQSKLQGNNTIYNICFFNLDLEFLPELSILGDQYNTERVIDLSSSTYASVRYVQFGAFNYSSDFSQMYAKLIPKYDIEYIKDNLRIVHYNKLLRIGDSLTNALMPSVTYKWSYFVCQLLGIPSQSNVGVSGSCMANVGENSIYSNIQALTTDSDVDIITLWGGTNDWGSNVVLGDFATQIEPSTRDVTTFYGGLIANVIKLLTLYPSKRIILIGTTPRITATSTYHTQQNTQGLLLEDYVDAVKEVAEWYGIPFIDLLRTSGINELNISQFMDPQGEGSSQYYLHFNQYGEEQIGNRIASFIEAVG